MERQKYCNIRIKQGKNIGNPCLRNVVSDCVDVCEQHRKHNGGEGDRMVLTADIIEAKEAVKEAGKKSVILKKESPRFIVKDEVKRDNGEMKELRETVAKLISRIVDLESKVEDLEVKLNQKREFSVTADVLTPLVDEIMDKYYNQGEVIDEKTGEVVPAQYSPLSSRVTISEPEIPVSASTSPVVRSVNTVAERKVAVASPARGVIPPDDQRCDYILGPRARHPGRCTEPRGQRPGVTRCAEHNKLKYNKNKK